MGGNIVHGIGVYCCGLKGVVLHVVWFSFGRQTVADSRRSVISELTPARGLTGFRELGR